MIPLPDEGEIKLYDVFPDDPLQFIYRSTVGLMQFKIIRIALFLTFFIHITVSIVFICELMVTFNSELLVTYGPMIFIFASGLMGIGVIFAIEHRLKVLLGQTIGRLWAFDVTSELYKRIVKESKSFLLSVFINNFMLAVSVFFSFPIGGHNDNIYYVRYLFERILPKYSTYLCHVYYATIPFLEYMMMFNPILLLYNTTQLKFQVYHLNELIQDIGKEFAEMEDSELLCDEKYQSLVAEQLKICIQRHRTLKFMERQFNDLCYLPLIGCMGFGIVAFISLFFGIIVTRQETYLPRVGATLMFASVTTFFAIAAGQLLTNESLKILETAGNSRWTSWSEANRKSLLIFMINAQKPFVIGTAFFLCEYPFIITAGKFISSICAFFLELARRREEQKAEEMALLQ